MLRPAHQHREHSSNRQVYAKLQAMKSYCIGVLVLWAIVFPPTSTRHVRIEQCCFPTRAKCEATLKRLNHPGTCEVEKHKAPQTLSMVQPPSLD
jgi:hypothetical protein